MQQQGWHAASLAADSGNGANQLQAKLSTAPQAVSTCILPTVHGPSCMLCYIKANTFNCQQWFAVSTQYATF